MYTWVSAYIYHGALNDLLCQGIRPFLQQHSELFNPDTPYFFIRYPEGGDHIRLRMQTTREEKVVDLLAAHIYTFDPTARIRLVPYEPEISRYGNIHSIKWAEELFYHSSVAVMEWMAETANPAAKASIQAIQFHLQLLRAANFSFVQQLEICDHFIGEWLQIFHPQRAALTDKADWLATFDKAFSGSREKITHAMQQVYGLYEDACSPLLRGSRRPMQQYRQSGLSASQLMTAVSSIMHMTHNRLGIDNSEEAYIMYCTKACLQYIQQYDTHFPV